VRDGTDAIVPEPTKAEPEYRVPSNWTAFCRISKAESREVCVAMREKILWGWDRIQAGCELGWMILAAVLASLADLISGREIPHPDLKQAAPSPEPVQQNRAA
jgi:hypothetical protein